MIVFVQPTTQPTILYVLYDLCCVWQSPRVLHSRHQHFDLALPCGAVKPVSLVTQDMGGSLRFEAQSNDAWMPIGAPIDPFCKIDVEGDDRQASFGGPPEDGVIIPLS